MAALVLYAGVLFASLFALTRLFRGAPYVPMKEGAVRTLVALCAVKKGEKAADLGSGDGRVVLALAEAGAEAHGFEHDPFLVRRSRRRIGQAGLSGQAKIHRRNFWDEDLSPYAVVTVFGVSRIMKKLEGKLEKELQPGARVASYLFRFPTWRPDRKEGGVYLYRR